MEQQPVNRKLAAIFSADVQGYSRLMGDDEEATIRTLTGHREVMFDLIRQHRGRVVDSPGDNMLAEFASVVDAVRSAVEIQKALKVRNADLPDHRKMAFRIGINLGDVVVEGERIYGDGVNIAARLESLAEGGGICISATVYEQVERKLPLSCEFMGEQAVKNIARPVRAYQVRMAPGDAPAKADIPGKADPQKEKTRAHYWKWAVAGLAVLAVAVVVARNFDIVRESPPPRSMPMRGPMKASMRQEALTLPDKPSIAVLPFLNMSGNKEEDYFSDGITEDLITDISKVSGLFVISRNSAFTYKGRSVNVKQVGKELGVRYVLEGSVRKAGSQLRITAQLIDATSGFHVWAERYDRKLAEIFTVQDEVAKKIVAALKVKLTRGEQARLGRKPTNNLEAYDLFLRGVRNMHRSSQESVARARELFTKAFTLDPNYAEPYVGLGWAYLLSWTFQWTQDPRTLDRALELAEKARAIDDSAPKLHKLLSKTYLWKMQHESAIAEARRAIRLDPNDADGYEALGEILVWSGQPERAIDLVKKAVRLNPTNTRAGVPWLLGHAFMLSGKKEMAIAQFNTAIALNPNFLPAHAYQAFVLTGEGKLEEARSHMAAVRRISPGATADNLRGRLPYKDVEFLERFIATLKKVER